MIKVCVLRDLVDSTFLSLHLTDKTLTNTEFISRISVSTISTSFDFRDLIKEMLMWLNRFMSKHSSDYSLQIFRRRMALFASDNSEFNFKRNVAKPAVEIDVYCFMPKTLSRSLSTPRSQISVSSRTKMMHTRQSHKNRFLTIRHYFKQYRLM